MNRQSLGKPRIEAVPVARETLQDAVYRQLTTLILEGGIAPGQLITINALAEAFGVSAMPVREALRRLTTENALTVVSGRSIGIPRLTRERLDDLHRVRAEIEPLATAWAMPAITPAVLADLKAAFDGMEAAIAARDVNRYVRLNHVFHFAIYGRCGSEVMNGIIESLWLQITPYFHLLHDSGTYAVSNAHHRTILDALVGGDTAQAAVGVRGDIDSAYQVLLTLL